MRLEISGNRVRFKPHIGLLVRRFESNIGATPASIPARIRRFHPPKADLRVNGVALDAEAKSGRGLPRQIHQVVRLEWRRLWSAVALHRF